MDLGKGYYSENTPEIVELSNLSREADLIENDLFCFFYIHLYTHPYSNISFTKVYRGWGSDPHLAIPRHVTISSPLYE